MIDSTTRAIDRLAMAHDASHYLLVPGSIATPLNAYGVAELFTRSRKDGTPLTFRSGGTSLSGQGVTDGILVDTRKNFRDITVLDAGARIRVQPGATVRQVNARLARHGRKLGPDPASEVACTIGGVVANNSSGMACGIEQNTYRTLHSMTAVLSSGTVLDTSRSDADEQLHEAEPDLYAGLISLRDRVRSNAASVRTIQRLFAMKNTMGYGVNALIDFERPVDILAHLLVGSEGTLGFVAEATFNTVELLPEAATALILFPTLRAATDALPGVVAAGPATIELMDATSLNVAKTLPEATPELRALDVDGHAALLVEFQAADADTLEKALDASAALFDELNAVVPISFSRDARLRASLWKIRKGLYASVAEARPSGTSALLEDVVVPVAALGATCVELTVLFEKYAYENCVIFGHAKDGNIHFMLNERFDDPVSLNRYQRFTEEMVSLILRNGGSLKAEHGTGRIMAPFVSRQYGTELHEVMKEIKRLCDPTGILNPGVLLSDDPTSYLQNLKPVATVEEEVDRCVECGYCEPACPSKDLTMTPRQRIVVRREMQRAESAGETELLAELRRDYEYDGIETCAVDGMCQIACPVSINTGDLVRRLRKENQGALEQSAWKTAAKRWGPVTLAGAAALTIADRLPAPAVTAATKIGRTILGDDNVPLYGADLPRGGTRRKSMDSAHPVAVYFPACIGTMFGPAAGGAGVSNAFLELCSRADVDVVIPEGIEAYCCGTPWKSKGHSRGYDEMTNKVLPALWEASRGGELPIVCDAASCTEGLDTMRLLAADAGGLFAHLRFIDSIEFVYASVIEKLVVSAPIESIALHPTCSSTQLGTNDMMTKIAGKISADVYVPDEWGCCAFAGDRGLLHPELTAAATSREAAEVGHREFEAYASTNRTCEIGLSRATGRNYQHLLELVEIATR